MSDARDIWVLTGLGCLLPHACSILHKNLPLSLTTSPRSLAVWPCSDQVQSLDHVFREMAVLESRRTWAAGKLVLFLRSIFRRRRQRVCS